MLLFLLGLAAVLQVQAARTAATESDDETYQTERGFRHPGGLHTQADFDRVRRQLAENHPKVVQAYQILASAAYAQSSAATYPVETIVRGGGSGENYINAARGATIAYQNALRWKIEDNRACAQHAVDVLMAWARVTKQIGGDSNYALAAGLYGYQFAQAAELMRDYEGWSREDFHTFQRWMLDVWYPLAIGFLRGRNGTWQNSGKWWQAPGHYWSNWGLCNALCVISIGVLCDDVNIYNQGMSFIKYDQVGTFTDPRTDNPIHNDGLTEFWGNLVVTTADWENETGAYGKVGQMNESGRDAGHCGMALGLAVDIAQQGWSQGDDLFSYMDHRLAAGIEYVAAQTQSVSGLPWTNYMYGTSGIYYTDGRCWTMTEPVMGAQVRPYWGTVIGHYEGVKGVPMPYSELALQQMGVDGGGQGATSGGYDHLGYSVLMNTRDSMANRATAPVELQPCMVVEGKTLQHNELGMLTNTFATTALNQRGVAPGTVITLSPSLPEGTTDTGLWRWDTGQTTREITVTAHASYVYRVHYTNAYGVESEQCYSIAVLGDGQPTTLTPSITVDGETYQTSELTIQYGDTVTLALQPCGEFGNFEWETGQTTSSITLKHVTQHQQITGCFINQAGRRNYQTFTLNITPIVLRYTVGAQTSALDGEILANEGDDVTLIADVATDLRNDSMAWENGETTSEFFIPAITTSQQHTFYYTLDGTAYSQTFSIMVLPASPLLFESGNYQIRLRNTDLYLTGLELGHTVCFAPLESSAPRTQTWCLERNGSKPNYNMILLTDSSRMNIQGKLVKTTFYPMRMLGAAGTSFASLYTSSTSEGPYLTVDGSGVIDFAGATALYGFPFELIPVATDLTDVQAVRSADTCPSDAPVYDLLGRRVKHRIPGRFYLVNGKTQLQ